MSIRLFVVRLRFEAEEMKDLFLISFFRFFLLLIFNFPEKLKRKLLGNILTFLDLEISFGLISSSLFVSFIGCLQYKLIFTYLESNLKSFVEILLKLSLLLFFSIDF